MTTYDHALQVLDNARRPGEMRIHPYDAVEALAQAGLLAPDLPEPIEEKDDTAWWEPCGPEYTIYLYNEPLTERHLVGIDETPYALKPNEAYDFALAVLAAVHYKKKASGDNDE